MANQKTEKTEKTALEAKQEQGARMVVVLRRCSTNTDHNPGDIISWTGPLSEYGVMREMTEDERDEFDARMASHRAQFGEDTAAPAQSVPVREEILRQALANLNPENDADWLDSGQPAVAAVNRELLKMGATPDTSSRAEIRSIAPDFVRPSDEPTGAASDVPVDPVGMAPAEVDAAPIEGGF